MPEGYDSHADYMDWVKADAATRQGEIRDALIDAFRPFIERREVAIINFSAMTAMDLAGAIEAHPRILKALLACCNVAGRAIERDLDIRGIDTYEPSLTEAKCAAIAGYLKPFLPPEIPVPALSELDRFFFVDKEIRARKGRWERSILQSLNELSRMTFRKRKFEVSGEHFELDAAAPEVGPIEVGIDVKRIEARRDIHKRADEIINKAAKFKAAFPNGQFAAVVYYPFTAEHVNVQNRLASPNIDALYFTSHSREQVFVAVGLLVDRLGIRGPRHGSSPVRTVNVGVCPSMRPWAISPLILFFARRKYSGSISLAMLLRLHLVAAIVVVPVPAKGSSTVSRVNENMRTRRRANSTGNGAG